MSRLVISSFIISWHTHLLARSTCWEGLSVPRRALRLIYSFLQLGVLPKQMAHSAGCCSFSKHLFPGQTQNGLGFAYGGKGDARTWTGNWPAFPHKKRLQLSSEQRLQHRGLLTSEKRWVRETWWSLIALCMVHRKCMEVFSLSPNTVLGPRALRWCQVLADSEQTKGSTEFFSQCSETAIHSYNRWAIRLSSCGRCMCEKGEKGTEKGGYSEMLFKWLVIPETCAQGSVTHKKGMDHYWS